jgi:molybdenum cofactor biosynthesis enzyme MoaA
MWETIKEAIIEIRKHTKKGSININTNASNPAATKELMAAGLNSMRVSLNSARKEIYTPYYRPNNYEFEDLIKCMKEVKAAGGWVSLNYFVFPGMTDSVAEYDALCYMIKETNLDMIQWRNFNIDPDWYLSKIGVTDCGESYGMKNLLQMIREEHPNVKFGYFNPSMERQQNFEVFAGGAAS